MVFASYVLSTFLKHQYFYFLSIYVLYHKWLFLVIWLMFILRDTFFMFHLLAHFGYKNTSDWWNWENRHKFDCTDEKRFWMRFLTGFLFKLIGLANRTKLRYNEMYERWWLKTVIHRHYIENRSWLLDDIFN